MIFKNIYFHNVDHFEEKPNGFSPVRVPEDVRISLNDCAKNISAYHCTGVEMRFVMKSDTVKIILNADSSLEAQVAYIMFGSLQGGWENSNRIIYTHDSVLTINKPDMDMLRKIHKDNNLHFSPEVVRVLLPYTHVNFVDVIGDICPPDVSQMPSKKYLSYGSSITHGSLSLCPVTTYSNQVAENLKVDVFNLGLAGSAHLEAELAQWIVSRKDWDFMTAEMGINMLEMSVEEFTNRASAFLDILEKDERPVLCTDIFTTGADIHDPKKTAAFRNVIHNLTKGRFPYRCGTEIMTSTDGLSADFVHPNIHGVNEIAKNMTDFIKQELGDKLF